MLRLTWAFEVGSEWSSLGNYGRFADWLRTEGGPARNQERDAHPEPHPPKDVPWRLSAYSGQNAVTAAPSNPPASNGEIPPSSRTLTTSS